MLRRLMDWSLARPLSVIIGASVLVAVGVLSALRLPIDAVPDVTPVQVIVNTKTGALDPEKIESLVTRPIENACFGIQSLEEVRSISKYGLSQVTLIFEESTDLQRIRSLVFERLQTVKRELPGKLEPELGPVSTGLGEIVMYVVEAKPDTELAKKPEVEKLIYLRTVQDHVVRPALRRIRGVADVDSNGGYLRQVHINLIPERMETKGISADHILERLETVGESFGGSYIQSKGQQILIRTVPGWSTIADLAELPLGLNVRGTPIRLKDVALVREDHALRMGAATRDGEQTVLGTVLMRSGANSREVSMRSESSLRELRLPEDVQVSVVYSRRHLVDATIGTVRKNLIEGAALVVFVLLLLMGNLRASLIVMTAIPLSMMFAFWGMNLSGVTANLMSLGAIDFGLLVDGAVVLVENILARLNSQTQAQTLDRRQVVLEASSEVIGPVVKGLFLIAAVYFPVLMLEGIEGKMFRPMAITIILALLGSIIVAVFVMPVLAHFFLQQKHHRDTRLFAKLRTLYRRALSLALGKRPVVFALALLLIALAMLLTLKLGSDFIPRLDEGDLVVNVTRDSRISIDRSVEEQKKAEGVIRAFPEVDTVFSRLGTPESATDPMGPHLADTFVILKPEYREKTENKLCLFNSIREKLGQVAPLDEVSENQPIEMRFNEILEGSRADVSLRVLGPDLERLLTHLELAQNSIKDLQGIDSLNMDPLTALRRSAILNITPRFGDLASIGLPLPLFNRLVETFMSGYEIGSFMESGVRFPVVVHLDEGLRDRLDSIRDLPLSLPQGGTVPLNRVADIKIEDQVTTIARSWGRRYAALAVNLADRDLDSFVREAQARVSEALSLDSTESIEWGGQYKNLERARWKILLMGALLLVIVFAVLWQSFGSLKLALAVFSSIPMATVGGVFALAARDLHLSVSAGVGFIALVGICLLNALVLVNVLNASASSKQRVEGESPLDVVVRAAESRLRPVLATASVAALGFLPMALSSGLGAEVQKPLATVVIGGLISSTLLTLFVLPALFISLGLAGGKLRR